MAYSKPKTKAEVLVRRLVQAIDNNPALFAQGTTLTEAQFCTITGLPYKTAFLSYQEQTFYNLTKVSRNTSLNAILSRRGLYCKSTNYYTSFEILSAQKTKAKARRLKSQSKAKESASDILTTGAIKHNGHWSKLNKTERDQVIARVAQHVI